MEGLKPNGLLSVEVKAPPIVAGTLATVSLVIRNPFDQQVVIESIQAPSSAPLLPTQTGTEKEPVVPDNQKTGAFSRFFSGLAAIRVNEVSVGSLTAEFPAERGRSFHINMEPKSKLTMRAPFGPQDHIHINNAEGAEVVIDNSTMA